MKRTPMKPSTKPMARKTPMARGTVRMKAKKPAAAKPKRAAREREDRHLADLCRNQPCYLLVPGVRCAGEVVPCHSNQLRHGKGMGIKASRMSVPGCCACHAEIDQGHRLTKEQKFALWDDAYARWEPVRERLLNPPAQVDAGF